MLASGMPTVRLPEHTGKRMTTLNRKPDMAIFIDRPVRIPRYLPSVIIRISHISSKTAMGRSICRSDDTSARLDELVDHAYYLRLAGNIVRQRKGARRGKTGSVHIFFKRRLLERAKHEAVHLIEDDFLILEDRRPAKAPNIKPTGPREIANAKCNDRNLVLHIQSLSLAAAPLRQRCRSWDTTPQRRSGPACAGTGLTAPISPFSTDSF